MLVTLTTTMGLNPLSRDTKRYLDAVGALEVFMRKHPTLSSIDTNNAVVCMMEKTDEGYSLTFELDGKSVTHTYLCIPAVVRMFINIHVLNNHQTIAAIHYPPISDLQQTIYFTSGVHRYHYNEVCAFNVVDGAKVKLVDLFKLKQPVHWCNLCVSNELKALLKLWATVKPALKGKVVGRADGTFCYREQFLTQHYVDSQTDA